MEDVPARDCRMWTKAVGKLKAQAVACSLNGVSFDQLENRAHANISRLLNVPNEVTLVAVVKE